VVVGVGVGVGAVLMLLLLLLLLGIIHTAPRLRVATVLVGSR
jgi:hypothetical protein